MFHVSPFFLMLVVDESEAKLIEVTKATIKQLEEKFDDLVSRARKHMVATRVDVQDLLQSITLLHGDLKSEHKLFIQEKEEKLRKVESINDVFITANGYWDFLNYSLLQHVIGKHASDEIKKAMQRYSGEITQFRKMTKLRVFSKVHKRKPKKADDEFKKLFSEHKINWSTATLEDVEQIRNDICNELSLSTFSLQLAAVKMGCVVLTWLVPQSLVAHIQKAITLSSQTMRQHHVSQLTVDGFITYDSHAGDCICTSEYYIYWCKSSSTANGTHKLSL